MITDPTRQIPAHVSFFRAGPFVIQRLSPSPNQRGVPLHRRPPRSHRRRVGDSAYVPASITAISLCGPSSSATAVRKGGGHAAERSCCGLLCATRRGQTSLTCAGLLCRLALATLVLISVEAKLHYHHEIGRRAAARAQLQRAARVEPPSHETGSGKASAAKWNGTYQPARH